jgi:UDP-N-acetylmuramate--alanine ligase
MNTSRPSGPPSGKMTLYLLPIYYAGGTAQKNISSEDIIQGLGPVAFKAQAVKGRDELLARLKGDARPENCVLIMGARDPSRLRW